MRGCIVLYVFCSLWLPVLCEQGYFFLFWKTTSLELIPRTQYVQRKIQGLLLRFFSHELINSTTLDEFDSLEVAQNMYNKLNLTSFPSTNVLDRERKKPFYFVRSLVKENFRGSQAFYNVLVSEKRFRCSIDDSLARYMCMKLKLITHSLQRIINSTREQLNDFFHAKSTLGLQPLPLETKMLSLLNDSTRQDEDEHRLNQKDISEDEDDYYDDMSHLEGYGDLLANLSSTCKHRNTISVALLYGLYKHMLETEAALTYALKELDINREYKKDCKCSSRAKKPRG